MTRPDPLRAAITAAARAAITGKTKLIVIPGGKKGPLFNPAQLATFDDAVAWRKVLNYAPAFYTTGRQVLPWWGKVDSLTSGIYIPTWTPGPQPAPIPSQGLKQFFHFRFDNGMEGMNVGLVIDLFSRYPTSPLYVLGALLQEVQTGARS